ncbi:SDR family oxidoreductase [Bradyrhizobium sp. SSUT112]|uniref:SDR family oxidoreductase n=1 Tax=Bradyrhizobium sp. SSUT112 TaxID=3040604 RepID=UPI002447CAA7|nr:SDR family oxidoreductase [Bradyrhizobium sp. SSUT112]MDH2357277.1 SDR family oxidoreductase [Bradyrhizobium sp. SSUT112]
MTKPLSGKAALVTGASRGIGAAIAARLAADGARVAITYQGSVEKAALVVANIAALGGEAFALKADSADVDAVREAVAETTRRFGRIDILVNNAGIGAGEKLIEQVSLSTFEACVAVNFRAVFVAMQAAAQRMTAGGRIITIGSASGDRVAFAGGAVYAATKAAVVGLTRGAAWDHGPRGITVNVVQPGPINTEMNPADGPWAEGERKQVALGRFGETSDVAGMVAYLAGDEARFVTGACLNVDGGFCA